MQNNHLEKLDAFINENELYSFDALIEIELHSGETEKAIYITTIAELLPSIDGTFEGEAEKPLFFLMNNRQYKVIEPAEIKSLKLLQKEYLKNLVELKRYVTKEEGKKHYARLADQNELMKDL
jgi:hypothetical protein